MIENALRKLIVDHAGIGVSIFPSTEVGDVTKALPKVCYTLVSAPRGYSDDGPVGIVTARYQLDVFAATLTQARGIVDAVRQGTDGFAGTLDATPILRVSWPDGESWGGETPIAGQNVAVARVRADVRVTYREATAV